MFHLSMHAAWTTRLAGYIITYLPTLIASRNRMQRKCSKALAKVQGWTLFIFSVLP
jgi:hypothetical protein